jgi:hypothetical protein
MELDVIVATTNEEKMREFRHFFYGYSINLSSLKDISLNVPINETGTTFLDNALIKARAVSRYVNKPVLADDSGLPDRRPWRLPRPKVEPLHVRPATISIKCRPSSN